MKRTVINNSLNVLSNELNGELHTDELHKAIYATDASVYRAIPLAVAYPKNDDDIVRLISFANKYQFGLIPRTAGTSLAGQCVGEGYIVVDVSKYFTAILDFDAATRTVTVQPGVIRDELNLYLSPHELFFSPNTSTSSRCMIGGMVGNNSSGSTSIAYGVTRDKVVEIEAYLSDGTKVIFSELSSDELSEKAKQTNLEGQIYRLLLDELSDKETQERIRSAFPKESIHRRNSGYAVDALIKRQPFASSDQLFNLCQLLTGSEGTLVFMTKIKLRLDPLPPLHRAMLAPHFSDVLDACRAVKHLITHRLFACEMMDKVILDCTKNNIVQAQNRFFVEGDPQAILMLELCDETASGLEEQLKNLQHTIDTRTKAYACPKLTGNDIAKAHELRKSGLGVLGNMVGDPKGVACIEDTAVDIEDLENYISEFTELMHRHGQQAVYYAHAGAGELHLRPILNLKKQEDVVLFRQITTEVAHLVKKYRGAMSGEHGNGRARAEFISLMLGEENYRLLERIKMTFDPKNIFNPKKIIHAPPMDTALRYEVDREEPNIDTFMDFSDSQGYLRAAEKCNGSGECRQTQLLGGTMCPSYQATRNEKDTTRARANALREFLTQSKKTNVYDHTALKEVLDLCLGCKACLSECPSNVDMASLRAEFLYQYYKSHRRKFRDIVFAYNTKLNALISAAPLGTNIMKSRFVSSLSKNLLGIHPDRTLPVAHRVNFDDIVAVKNPKKGQEIVLLIDEYSEYLDTNITVDAITLLTRLGYRLILKSFDSGRSFISKGFLKQAKRCVDKIVGELTAYAERDLPILGIEPSCVLGFRDDYLRLATDIDAARYLSKKVVLAEEFLAKEAQSGCISSEIFTKDSREVSIHCHCHQKSLSKSQYTVDIMSFPTNYKVSLLQTGCCGMAGSFGYEREHHNLSMQIGRLRLFPQISSTTKETIIVANGTSCRHQIADGTARKALHPISALRRALI